VSRARGRRREGSRWLRAAGDPDPSDRYDLTGSVPSPFATRYADWVRAGRGALTPRSSLPRTRGGHPALLHFLLIHDRRSGRLDIIEFDDARPAVAAYGDLGLEHLDDRELEIVLVGADSLDTVRRTHEHCFSTGQPRLPDLAGT
jgi:hypothetical protein